MRNLKRLAVWLTMTALLFCLSFTAFAAVEDTGFSDVDAGAWYAEAVSYVQEHGIMNGTTSTAFSPDATTTRGQMAVVSLPATVTERSSRTAPSPASR